MTHLKCIKATCNLDRAPNLNYCGMHIDQMRKERNKRWEELVDRHTMKTHEIILVPVALLVLGIWLGFIMGAC